MPKFTYKSCANFHTRSDNAQTVGSVTAIACYRCKKGWTKPARISGSCDRNRSAVLPSCVFGKSAGASHCHSPCPSLHVHCILFCGKEAHIENICLIAASPPARPRRNLLLERKSPDRLVNGGQEPQRTLCTCRTVRHNRDHEILTSPRPPLAVRHPFEIMHACAPINSLLRHMDVAPVIFGACRSSVWFNQPRFVCQTVRTYSWFRNFVWD